MYDYTLPFSLKANSSRGGGIGDEDVPEGFVLITERLGGSRGAAKAIDIKTEENNRFNNSERIFTVLQCVLLGPLLNSAESREAPCFLYSF